MRFAYILIITILFITISCKKDKPIYNGTCTGDCRVLQGKVVEQQTGMPLENIMIRIYYKEASVLFGNGETHLGDTRTNSEGFYSFAFPKGAYSDGRIQLRAGISGYINRFFEEGFNTIASLNIEPNQTDTIENELKLWKSAFLKIRVSTSTTTNFTKFYFNNKFPGSHYGVYSVPGNRTFDTTFTILTASDIPTFIVWTTQQGSIISGADTVIVPFGTVGNLAIQL